MAYVPEAHKKYNMLPESDSFGTEVFEYNPDTVWKALQILGEKHNLVPYNYQSYEAYFDELDRIASFFEGNKEALEIIEKLRREIKEMNQKEEWSILKYIGPTDENGLGLTNGKNYYWPTSKNNPVYNGVVDNEEFTSYLYPTDSSLWEILEDPTGMAYNTIYGNGRKLLKEDYDRMAEERYIHLEEE